MTKAYIVDCRTGCTCCARENHKRGPYSSREVAERKVEAFRSIPLLASQYAPRGVYDVGEYDAEALADGRLIVGERVFRGWADETDDEISGTWL